MIYEYLTYIKGLPDVFPKWFLQRPKPTEEPSHPHRELAKQAELPCTRKFGFTSARKRTWKPWLDQLRQAHFEGKSALSGFKSWKTASDASASFTSHRLCGTAACLTSKLRDALRASILREDLDEKVCFDSSCSVWATLQRVCCKGWDLIHCTGSRRQLSILGRKQKDWAQNHVELHGPDWKRQVICRWEI